MPRYFKIISITVILSCFVLLALNQTIAANLQNISEPVKEVAEKATLIKKGGTAKSLEEIVGAVITTVLGVFGVIYFIFIIVAGIWWQSARGEREKVEKAKELLKESTIGLAIILGAYALTYFIVNALLDTTALKKAATEAES